MSSREQKSKRGCRASMRSCWGALVGWCLVFVGGVIFEVGAQEVKEIKVGFLGALSGQYSQPSQLMLMGATLGVEECNARLRDRGLSLKLVVEDDRFLNSGVAISAVRRFADIENAVAILAWSYSAARPISSALGKRPIPVVFMWDNNKAIADMGRNFFGIGPDATHSAGLVADDIVRSNRGRVALLTLQDEWSERMHEALQSEFRSTQRAVVVDESVPPDQSDYRALLLRAKRVTPDALVVVSFGSSFVSLVSQARRLLPGVPVYAVGVPANDLKLLGLAGEGILVTNGWVTGDLGKKLREAATRSSLRFGAPLSPVDLGHAAYGYQGAVAVCESMVAVLRDGGEVKPSTLVDALREVSFDVGLGTVAPGKSVSACERLLVWRGESFSPK